MTVLLTAEIERIFKRIIKQPWVDTVTSFFTIPDKTTNSLQIVNKQKERRALEIHAAQHTLRLRKLGVLNPIGAFKKCQKYCPP
jgi:hypothetical protein